MQRITIGIDGGGTRTRAAALDCDGRVLARSECGSINYYFMPMSEAIANLRSALDLLSLPCDAEIAAIGIGDPALNDKAPTPSNIKFKEELRSELRLPESTEIHVKSDVFMALYALAKGRPGSLIISGTGSMGAGLDRLGRIHTVGGWGFPTADDGSGYYIAREAICRAYEAHDGVGEATMLTNAVPEFFAVSTVYELLDYMNGGNVGRAHIASLSKCVDDCARAGDGVSRSILEDAANKLVRYALSLNKHIDSPGGIIGMYGGVLTGNATVRDAFCRRVEEMSGITPIFPDITPEEGAAIFARSKREETKI